MAVFKRGQVIKRVRRGEMIPPWFGIAWIEHKTYECVCLPLPLNLAAAAIRGVLVWGRYGWTSVRDNPRDAYMQGLHEGLEAANNERKGNPDALKAADEMERLRSAMEDIAEMTDADNPSSYRADDREGCLDTVFATASAALTPNRRTR